MGKHIKTKLDYEMIAELAKEVNKLDPENTVLAKYLAMENFEGSELRKVIKWVKTIAQQKD